MGREQKGEGKPRKRKDGTWQQYLDLGYRDGKRVRKKVEGKDRNDVVRRVAEFRRKHEAGIDITEKPQTLREYAAYCLEDVLPLTCEPGTVESYRDMLDRHALPVLGKLAVDKVTTPQIQKLITGLSREKAVKEGDKRYHAKLKPRSLALIRTALRAVFNQAIVDKLRTDNPVDGVKIPKIGRSPGKALAPEQTRMLLDAIRGDPYELAIRPGVLWAHFKAAARSVGLGDYRLHDLRHSCASYLKARGWDLKRISVHLGHANTNITSNLYVHLFSDVLDSAAEDVESYIRGDNHTEDEQKKGRG